MLSAARPISVSRATLARTGQLDVAPLIGQLAEMPMGEEEGIAISQQASSRSTVSISRGHRHQPEALWRALLGQKARE